MSSHIDPRLQYGQAGPGPPPLPPPPPPAPTSYYPSSSGSVSRAHQTPELPPLPHAVPPLQHVDAALQQPYYRYPPHAHSHRSGSAALDQSPGQHSGHSDDQVDQYGDFNQDLQGGNVDPNGDPKRSRACEACRGLKVRCDQHPDRPDEPCKRCAKAGRPCITTAPMRKRQKKTDSRVAELEKKIDALTASLHSKQSGSGDDFTSSQGYDSPRQSITLPSRPSNEGGYPAPNPPSDGPRKRSRTQDYSPSMRSSGPRDEDSGNGNASPRRHPSSIHAHVDGKIDEMMSRETASAIFDRYITDMIHQMPSVAFNPGTTAADIRTTKPVLFLAIVCAAAVGMTEMSVQEELSDFLRSTFADCIIRDGQKSFELIQALIVSNLWYRPPKAYEQVNFYQLIHIAAVMAIDLDLGKRYNNARTWRLSVVHDEKERLSRKQFASSDTVEARRTWLACYFMCSQTSMTLRRPNFIRWSTYMDECIEVLESSLEALPSDKLLCQHVRLQHINEEIGAQFMMDDPSANISIADSRVQFQLKAFERQLSEWADNVPESVMSPTLKYSQFNSGLYMHEVAMHINHNIDDFRAPFTEDSLKSATGQSNVLSSAHSHALSEILASVHAMFRTFLSFDLDTIRALPIFYFVRVAYSTVILIKLHFAVTAKDSQVGELITEEDLLVESYLDSILGLFKRIDEEDTFRPPNKFIVILHKLRGWFQKNRDSMNNPKGSSTISSSGQSDAAAQSRPVARGYNSGHNPLQFLSEVATGNPNGPGIGPHLQDGGWYQGGAANAMTSPMNMPGMHPGMMGPDIETMDMTLGMTDADLSSFLLGDPCYSTGNVSVPHEMYQGSW